MIARLPKIALGLSLVSALAAVYLAAPGARAAAPKASAKVAATELTTLDRGVLQQLNAIRAAHHLVPLKIAASLNASAAAHSVEMGQQGYFEHNSADGTAFWKRIQHWYGSGTYGYWSVGENLLWSSPEVDSVQALTMWMNSPEHRANILNPRWRQIGVSAVHLDTAPGTYQGMPVTIITTDFGVRR